LGNQVNLRYTGRFDGLRLKGRFWQQRVRHAMDMGPDRYFYGFGMPMLTEATTQGLQLQAEKDLGETDLLRVGAERQTYVLYDWWPPVGGSMGPNAFWNVDNGRRLRSGAFAEWQTEWREHWTVLAGLRADRIDSDAEAVQGYDNGLGAIWGNDAAAFNARRRERRDDLIDVALTARYQPHAGASYEFGLARKARAPNLYQRYAWSTQPMAALMNNFMGDGNGYVGDVDLRPEVADKLAFTADWHDAADQNWAVKATLHVSRVHDFMDARRCNFSQCSAANVTATEGFVLLQYQNVPAQLYGLDLSGRSRLLRGAGWGELNANLVLSVVRGRNLAANDPLYNLMPPNLRLSLEHKRGGLTTTAELVAVGAKHRVSQVRNEIPTPGYALAHLRASYEWRRARLDVGVDNLFNRFYFPPLGGAYLGQGRSMTSAGIAWGTAVPGAGRSINTALSVWF
jgi:iron complex outermembrane receptor protein